MSYLNQPLSILKTRNSHCWHFRLLGKNFFLSFASSIIIFTSSAPLRDSACLWCTSECCVCDVCGCLPHHYHESKLEILCDTDRTTTTFQGVVTAEKLNQSYASVKLGILGEKREE